MAIKIDPRLTARALLPKVERLFEFSATKILALEKTWNPADGTPVFTAKGRYTSRGWTEWTQGFQFGSALLQFDATGDKRFLEIGRRNTVERMATHVSHTGVHDHGFNNVSTYGNLLRLMREERIESNEREKDFYELALKVSGAVQAARWSRTADGTGYIYSFNGPHSLFIDAIRSLRSLAIAHKLGHVLMGERDARISLLDRLIQHTCTTACYAIYYGDGRDAYDLAGRVAHESIFNTNDGSYRCPNSQQGYSPFSTWTRGLAWAILGFAEQLEFFETLQQADIASVAQHSVETVASHSVTKSGRRPAGTFEQIMLKAAGVTAGFYSTHCCQDGIPIWDTGAPNLHRLGDYAANRAEPFNDWEPVDSSAAAIAAQGLLRLGNFLDRRSKDGKDGTSLRQQAFTIANTLFSEPYLCTHPKHQGLILHSVYHRPNGWDHIARGQKIPNGESSTWGDYHARELALMILREAKGGPYPTFFGCV